MKKSLFLLLIFLPGIALAKFGWYHRYLSVFYGGLAFQGGSSPNIEIIFDKGIKSCSGRRNYYGVGLVGSFHESYTEYGIKVQFNPTYFSWAIPGWANDNRLYPYFYLQGNQKLLERPPEKKDLNFRPGIGLITHMGIFPYLDGRCLLALRASFQIGYTLNDQFTDPNSGLVIELKIGLALNTYGVEKASRRARKG